PALWGGFNAVALLNACHHRFLAKTVDTSFLMQLHVNNCILCESCIVVNIAVLNVVSWRKYDQSQT
ncbi:hypothetical protein ACNRUP_005484, partial [Klebsiella oxytoca]